MKPATLSVLRRVFLPLNTIALVVVLIWAIQSNRIPILSRPSSGAGASATQPGFYGFNGQPLGADRGNGPGLGKPAPEFSLLGLDGTVLRLSDLRGKIVLVNFWATWCVPCRKEFPELVKAYEENKGDVVVVGVDLQENVDQVRAFAEDFGARFPIVIDEKGEVADAYRVLGLPSSYFIDRDGVLRGQYFGAMTSSIIAERLQEARLPQPAE